MADTESEIMLQLSVSELLRLRELQVKFNASSDEASAEPEDGVRDSSANDGGGHGRLWGGGPP